MRHFKSISYCLVLALLFTFAFSACGIESAEKYCYNCGKGILKDDSFCSHCGASVKEKDVESISSASKNPISTTKKSPAFSSSRAQSTKNTTTNKAATSTISETSSKTISKTTVNKTYQTSPKTAETTTAPKTTRTATQEELNVIYRSVYSETIAEYDQYKSERLEYIAEIDAKIAALETKEQALYAQYKEQVDALHERYKNEFIPIASLERDLYNSYQNNVAPIRSEISELKVEKERVQAALDESEGQVEEVIQAKHLAAVEEFQQKTLS